MHGGGQCAIGIGSGVNHISVHYHTEKPSEIGGVAHHVFKSDQCDPGTRLSQLCLYIQHQNAQILHGHVNLHDGNAGGFFDQGGVKAAGDDDITSGLF